MLGSPEKLHKSNDTAVVSSLWHGSPFVVIFLNAFLYSFCLFYNSLSSASWLAEPHCQSMHKSLLVGLWCHSTELHFSLMFWTLEIWILDEWPIRDWLTMVNSQSRCRRVWCIKKEKKEKLKNLQNNEIAKGEPMVTEHVVLHRFYFSWIIFTT